MLIKNAIVLIDQTDLEISEGKARLSAVIDASVSRVRPVSLGVLTTVLGVVPLIWDPFFKSLAVVIIFGYVLCDPADLDRGANALCTLLQGKAG